MDNGTPIALDDPMSVNGVELTNDFTTITAGITGTGSQLVLTYEARTDGGNEAFAFREVLLTGNTVGGEILGDYNDNGLVEQGDLNQVLNNWGSAFDQVAATWILQRPTEGIVDQAELNVVLNRWGSDTAPDFRGSAVPEPTAALMLPAGIVLVLRRGRAKGG